MLDTSQTPEIRPNVIEFDPWRKKAPRVTLTPKLKVALRKVLDQLQDVFAEMR
jgi:hypothetical protein